MAEQPEQKGRVERPSGKIHDVDETRGVAENKLKISVILLEIICPPKTTSKLRKEPSRSRRIRYHMITLFLTKSGVANVRAVQMGKPIASLLVGF